MISLYAPQHPRNANTGHGKITRWKTDPQKTDHKKNPQGDFERIKIREDEEIFCLGLTELLKELKYRKKCLWAVGVIHKYYLGWLVRREYRSKFRAIAGPKIIKKVGLYMHDKFFVAFVVTVTLSASALFWSNLR